jgi:hypothetical protein
MDALQKPFSRKEYLHLFDMASIRTHLVKLRQVRNDEKFYPTDDRGKSYFDHYPGMFLYHVYTLSDKYHVLCLICFVLLFALFPFRNLFLIVIVTGQVNSVICTFCTSVLRLMTFCCAVSTVIVEWVILECWIQCRICYTTLLMYVLVCCAVLYILMGSSASNQSFEHIFFLDFNIVDVPYSVTHL